MNTCVDPKHTWLCDTGTPGVRWNTDTNLWNIEADNSFVSLTPDLPLALGIPNYSNPFHTALPQAQCFAQGVLTQQHGNSGLSLLLTWYHAMFICSLPRQHVRRPEMTGKLKDVENHLRRYISGSWTMTMLEHLNGSAVPCCLPQHKRRVASMYDFSRWPVGQTLWHDTAAAWPLTHSTCLCFVTLL